jgi:hypothetical protein
MPARMTPTAWSRGAINALICGAIFFGAWSLVARVISYISLRTLSASDGPAFGALWGLVFLLFLGTWLHGRNAGGSVLLDCGPHPTRALFLLNAVLFLVMGVAGGFATASVSRSFGIAGPVFGILFGIYWLIMASGRLQIREGGLWQYWGLLRWEKIESCHWSGDSTLLVQAKTLLPFLGRGALPVPPEDKQAIEGLLQKHCPAWDRDF